MREYVVTLRSGLRITVRADRVVLRDSQYVELAVSQEPSIGNFDAGGGTVALFDRGQLVTIVAREHLVGEVQGEPVEGPDVVLPADSSDIPF